MSHLSEGDRTKNLIVLDSSLYYFVYFSSCFSFGSTDELAFMLRLQKIGFKMCIRSCHWSFTESQHTVVFVISTCVSAYFVLCKIRKHKEILV